MKTVPSRTQNEMSVNHKDMDPVMTSALIREILNSVEIGDLDCSRWKNPIEGCHSLTIVDPRYPLIHANGKGCSREYALASAYGEFIERLQCNVDKFFIRLGEILAPQSIFHDKVQLPIAELRRQSPEIMDELVETDTCLPFSEMECLPFRDVFNGGARYLPYGLMNLCVGSTGMCAGNTAEESVTQGICEIMERYPIRLLALGRLDAVPTIPIDDLSLRCPSMRRTIGSILDKDLQLIVKDCTMGGKIPVLAAIIIDEANNRFGVSYGCDPVFEVALQRSITELYQGREDLDNCYSLWKNNTVPISDIFNNVHCTLARLLREAPTVPFEDAFVEPGLSNTEYLTFMLDRIRKLGLSLFVRDFSFLGFPSYFVYVQEMSSPRPLTEADCRYHYQELDMIFRILYRLRYASRADLERLSTIFHERLLRNDYYSCGSLEIELQGTFHRTPVRRWLSSRLLMVFIFIDTGRFEDALHVLDQPLIFRADRQLLELYSLLRDYCDLMAQGAPDVAILEKLDLAHGNGAYGKSLEHLIAGNYASLYYQESSCMPGRKFDGLEIPCCLSLFKCQNCVCKNHCYVKRFLKIHGRLRKAYQPVDQDELGKLLQRLISSLSVSNVDSREQRNHTAMRPS